MTQLDTSVTAAEIKTLFSAAGPVKKSGTKLQPDGRKKFAIVEFVTAQDAEIAIARFNGVTYGGNRLGVDYVRYGGPSV